MNLSCDLKFESEPIIDDNNIFYVRTHEKYADKTRICLKNADSWCKNSTVLFIGLFRKNGLSILKCTKHNREFFRVQQDGKELSPNQIGYKEGFIVNPVLNSSITNLDFFFMCSSNCLSRKDQEINLHFEHIDKLKIKQTVVFRLYISQKPSRSFKLLNKKVTEPAGSLQIPAKKHKMYCSKPSTNEENPDRYDFKAILQQIVEQNDQIVHQTKELQKRLDNIDIRLSCLEVAIAMNN